MWAGGGGQETKNPPMLPLEVKDYMFWCVRLGQLSLFSHVLPLSLGVPLMPRQQCFR